MFAFFFLPFGSWFCFLACVFRFFLSHVCSFFFCRLVLVSVFCLVFFLACVWLAFFDLFFLFFFCRLVLVSVFGLRFLFSFGLRSRPLHLHVVKPGNHWLSQRRNNSQSETG
jgi:hypothetical protein